MTLHLPDGWVIDALSLARLEHQLGRAPAGTGAVVAPLVPLPSGASYRTLAENLALQPLGSVRRLAPGDESVPCARLTRLPGVPDDGQVVVVDLGTACHDPDHVDPALLIAAPAGRSPFPRRPIVVLLAVEGGDDDFEWARDTTNALITLDVEARLATTAPPPGPHLSRPCLADSRSLDALRPHVILTMDRSAAAMADAWCATSRHTTLVDLDPRATDPISLRSWTLGAGDGRHRGAVRSDAAPGALADLVRRLAAGPQPGPPLDPPGRSVAIDLGGRARPRPAARRSVVFSTGVEENTADERIDALILRLEDRGDSARRAGPLPEAADVDEADLLVLRSVPVTDELLAAIERRRARGQPTVVDLAVEDLDEHSPLGLTGPTRRLVDACGLATSPSAAWCAELRRTGVAAHRLRTPYPPPPLLVDAPGPTHSGDEAATLIWMLDPAWTSDTTVADAVSSALGRCLLAHPGLRLQVHGDPRRWPSTPAVPGRIEWHAGAPEPWQLIRADLVMWSPDLRLAAAAGEPLWLVRAGLSGVPTLVAGGSGAGTSFELLPPDLEVAGPDRASAWGAAVTWLLAEPTDRHLLGDEVRRRAEAACSDEAADRSVQELLTWAFGTGGMHQDHPDSTEEAS